ncbi:MAG: hypothetical protein Hens3KO_28940 [Henriciella sp.]
MSGKDGKRESGKLGTTLAPASVPVFGGSDGLEQAAANPAPIKVVIAVRLFKSILYLPLMLPSALT